MPVTVIPAVVTDATADIALGFLLCVARRILEADRFVRAGGYPGAQSALFLGGDVSEDTRPCWRERKNLVKQQEFVVKALA